MKFRLPILACVIVLGGCAYAIDKSIQDLTIETPGTENAICNVYVEGLRYRVRSSQTVNISRSREDLIVDCLAPGNRRKKVVIQPRLAKHIAGNVVTGVLPGLAWDYGSGAMFRYPDIVTVDFTNTPSKPEALPDQNDPTIKQPEEYMLEEFLPSRPRMNSDRFEPPVTFKKREKISPAAGDDSTMIETGGDGKDKGDLTPAVNPAGPASPQSGNAPPTPLYPGQ